MQPVRTDEYTIWLEPENGTEIQKIIDAIAQRAGTPSFLPHVTLLPGLQGTEEILIEKMRELATVEPFHITFTKVATGEAYHKCLFLECESSEELMSLRKKGEEIFEQPPTYYPHLSLGYGIDQELGEELAIELSTKQFDFKVAGISLWHAKGLVEEWRKVTQYNL